MATFVDEVTALKQAITSLETANFLIAESSRFNLVLKESIKLIERHNYIVRAIPKGVKRVTDLRSLVAHFYFVLSITHPGIITYKVDKVDLPVAKEFVEKIKTFTGYTFENSLDVCAQLVEIVLKFHEEFSFEPGILCNFRIFGQKEMSWVTKKAIDIYNRQRNSETELVLRADKETEEYEATHDIKFGFGDLEELIKLNEENCNGKKKRN